MAHTIRRTLSTALLALMALTVLILLAPAAQAEKGELTRFGSYDCEHFDQAETFCEAAAVAVDASDNSFYTLDDAADGGNYGSNRLRKWSPEGNLEVDQILPHSTWEADGQTYSNIAVDSVHHRLYALLSEASATTAAALAIHVFSTDPDCSSGTCVLVAPSDQAAIDDGVDDGVLIDFREPASASKAVDFATGIAVDPSTHKVVVLGVDDAAAANPKGVLQYIGEDGQPSTRIEGFTGGLDPDGFDVGTPGATVPNPRSLAIAQNGDVYVATGTSPGLKSEPVMDARIFRLAAETASATLVATDPAAREPQLAGFLRPGGFVGTAGSSIAVSADGSIVYIAEGSFAGMQIRGFSTATGLPQVVYGYLGDRSSTECYFRFGFSGALATGSGDRLVATSWATPALTPPEPVYLHVFDQGGSGCAVVRPAFTANSLEAETVQVNRGAEVSFDASSSDLTAQEAPVTAVEWDLDGNGSFETTKASVAEAATHTYATPGTYEVAMRVKAAGGIPPVTEPVTKTIEVVVPQPLASFKTSTKSPAAGATVSFDASASSDPGGVPSGIATYKWDFGDGATQETTNPSVSHAFANPAATALNRSVKLTVVNKEGTASDPVTQVISVAGTPAPPSNGGGSSGGSSKPPAPAPSPAPVAKKPAAKCRKGQIKKKGKCVKKKAKKHKKRGK